MFIAKLICNMTCTVVDTETAFLHGDSDEEIYMGIPNGITIGDNKNQFYVRLFMI
jgi:hypothetical protein